MLQSAAATAIYLSTYMRAVASSIHLNLSCILQNLFNYFNVHNMHKFRFCRRSAQNCILRFPLSFSMQSDFFSWFYPAFIFHFFRFNLLCILPFSFPPKLLLIVAITDRNILRILTM